ncbi:DNZ54_00345 family protein [Escherichia coli]
MKKKLISGLFLMLWMALLIAAMVYPQGIFPVLAASGVWVACLLTWGAIPVAINETIISGGTAHEGGAVHVIDTMRVNP